MKHPLCLILILLILGSLGLGIKPATAAGSTVTVACGTIDVGGPGAMPPGPFDIVSVTTGEIVGSISFVDNGGSFTGHGTFGANPGEILLAPPVSLFTAVPCTPANGVTWFNPGDGRVDGRPGDRIAVWCQITGDNPYIDVWGVMDNSTGQRLGTFNYSMLKAHGGVGVQSSNEGQVNIAVYMDQKIVIEWRGGPVFADGTGPFRKIVTCDFTKVAQGKK